jgi:hypothetical protein
MTPGCFRPHGGCFHPPGRRGGRAQVVDRACRVARVGLARDLLNGTRPMKPANESESDLRRAVIGYLEENPEAMDTLEGIAEWWVMRQRIRTSVSTIARVVRRLVDEGLLEELGPRERPRFRLKGSGATTADRKSRH